MRPCQKTPMEPIGRAERLAPSDRKGLQAVKGGARARRRAKLLQRTKRNKVAKGLAKLYVAVAGRRVSDQVSCGCAACPAGVSLQLYAATGRHVCCHRLGGCVRGVEQLCGCHGPHRHTHVERREAPSRVHGCASRCTHAHAVAAAATGVRTCVFTGCHVSLTRSHGVRECADQAGGCEHPGLPSWRAAGHRRRVIEPDTHRRDGAVRLASCGGYTWGNPGGANRGVRRRAGSSSTLSTCTGPPATASLPSLSATTTRSRE